MSHNPSAKRNRQFRSGETRGRRQVCGLATAVTPLPGPPTANSDIVASLRSAHPPAASPASPVSPGNPADKTG